MRLSYASLFPEKVKQAWFKRKRLNQSNPYDLPAGDYCLYDLYPLSAIAEPEIFITVEYRKDKSQNATLRCWLYNDKSSVQLSNEHLQSQNAPALCKMVEDLINQEPSLRKRLSKRKQEVQAACQTIAMSTDVPESSVLAETAIRKLTGMLEKVMLSVEPTEREVLLDQLLASLRSELLNSFSQTGDSESTT